MTSSINPGDVFGKLTIKTLDRKTPKGAYWLCRCACGVEKSVREDHLRNGRTVSCGCYRKALHTKHGYARKNGMKHPLYQLWEGMKSRCYWKGNKHYHNYGGRGIYVCDEWINSPEVFIAWAETNGYSEGLSIDREDNDDGYTPSNCRFVDRKTQQRNCRTNRMIEYEGKSRSMAEWAEIKGISYKTLSQRLYRGWSISRALVPPKPKE